MRCEDSAKGRSGLQNKDALENLLHGVTEARNELGPTVLTRRKPKLVLKIAPDLDEFQLADIAGVVKGSDIDGVIVSNTTIQRPSYLKNREHPSISLVNFLTHHSFQSRGWRSFRSAHQAPCPKNPKNPSLSPSS